MNRNALKFVIYQFIILLGIVLISSPTIEVNGTLYTFFLYTVWPLLIITLIVLLLYPFFELLINKDKYTKKTMTYIFTIGLFLPVMGAIYLYYSNKIK